MSKPKSSYAEYRLRIKQQIYEAYGGRCYCCGESDIRFMTVDHVNDDGGGRTRRVKGTSWYLDIVKAGFPADYRLACFNCNTGRYHNGGTCPHQDKDAET